jgi:SAM-dependent methyltransferase
VSKDPPQADYEPGDSQGLSMTTTRARLLEEIAGRREDSDSAGFHQRLIAEDRPVLDLIGPKFGVSWNPEREVAPPFKREELVALGDARAGEILEMRYGVCADGRRYTLAEIGELLSIGRERVRQIQNVSLTRMRRARRTAKIGAVRKALSALEEERTMGGSPDPAAIAYEVMARVYDDFTAHHNYKLWLERILPELEAHGLPGERLLDAACGTGKSFIPLLERGWDVTGSDIAEGMIEIAREKVRGAVPLTVADLRTLPVLGEFDLVWALGDVMNYLCDPADVVSALEALGRNLAPDGLLVFDTNTLQAYRTFFAQVEIVQRDDSVLVWTGMTDRSAEPGVVAEASFEVKGAKWTGVAPVLHRERHYPEAEVRRAVKQAGLVVLDVLGHGYDAVPHRPLDEARDIKAIYIVSASAA